MPSPAISSYHDLLSPSVAQESQARLEEQSRRRGLFFGDRPVCNVLRPRFLSPDQYHLIQARSRLLLQALAQAGRAALADSALRAQFGLAEWEEKLVQFDPGFRAASPTARLDAFLAPDTGELRFTEYNAETPAAPAYNDALTEIFMALPVMGEFLRRWRVQPLPARHLVLHALLDAYAQWGGRSEPPRIAILDWREVPTYSEFVLFEAYFKSQGLECVIADPRECEYSNGRLLAGGFYVNLIYKRVLLSELIERAGIDSPVVRAVRARAVCMVNPFRCKLLHKKASLAVLSDERNAPLFSPAQLQAIQAHIPWTRRVAERKTEYRGQPIDLLPFIVENREQMVLKANDEYGGKGILLGWETEPEAWEQMLGAALAEPYIVQERIPLPREPYPSLGDGRVEIVERMLDTDPFVFFDDLVDGCLTRLSTASLLNVSAGGGSTVPTFVVEARET